MYSGVNFYLCADFDLDMESMEAFQHYEAHLTQW